MIAELLDYGNRQYYAAHRSKSDPAVWEPLRLRKPTPAPAAEDDHETKIAKMKAFFGAAVKGRKMKG